MFAMTSQLQLFINCSPPLNTTPHSTHTRICCFESKFRQPIDCYSISRKTICAFSQNRFPVGLYGERLSFLGCQDGKFLVENWNRRKKRGVFVVRLKQGGGFNFGGGGGGGGDNSNTARLLGNLAFAIGLTYLSMNGQLGWVLDAIVSVWLLAVILPIVGLGAFIWWAGRDIVQSSCPNCGNDFQVFKSTLNDEIQLCPFCTQPFSVVGDKFVSDPVKFSNQSTTFGQAFSEFSARPKTGKDSSKAVVDVEAEIKDVD